MEITLTVSAAKCCAFYFAVYLLSSSLQFHMQIRIHVRHDQQETDVGPFVGLLLKPLTRSIPGCLSPVLLPNRC